MEIMMRNIQCTLQEISNMNNVKTVSYLFKNKIWSANN